MTDDDIEIVTGGGGCPFVTSKSKPHLGGNFDGGDLGTQYPNDLWPWLISQFGPQTMMDVGSGTGETAKWFQSQGVRAICLEGLEWNARKTGLPTLVWDLERGPIHLEGIDLIWCADVAEHIDERFVGNLLETVRHCKVLAFCHGTEEHANQGWHHVNNKSEAYWVEKLASVGMIESEANTGASREKGNHGWWPVSGRIYKPRGT